jgi:predicted transcriptional regulator
MAEREQLLQLAADIVSAHASNNPLSADQLPGLIQQVFSTLATVQQKVATPPLPEPAVSVRTSVRQDHLVCLDCGKHFSMLKRHLIAGHKLSPDQYRQRWQLLPTYPMVAPAYAKIRTAIAKKIGLGRQGAAGRRVTGRKATKLGSAASHGSSREIVEPLTL